MICIAGKNEIAVNACTFLLDEEIVSKGELCVLINATDHGIDTWQPSLRFFAEQRSLSIMMLEDLYEIEDLIFISLEYDKIIRPKKFQTKYLYNIHFSLLPKYKGMYTSIMPILKGEKESGVTLHKIDKGIDTGDIIAQKSFPISIEENSRQLYQKYLDNAYSLFVENIEDILDSKIKSEPQKAEGSTYYSKAEIDFSKVIIDYNKTAYEVHNQIRAYSFRDYQLPVFNRWNICKSEIIPVKSVEKPGVILNESDSFFEVATVDYNILLYKDYYSLIWEACANGNFSSIKKNIKLIPDIDLRNKNGWNALILATYNNHLKIVDILIEHGADVNAVNYKGTSVLMYAKDAAINSGDSTVFKKILQNGGKLDHRDNKGKRLLDYLTKENGNIIDIIQEYSNLYD